MARFSAIQWADRWLLCGDNIFGLVEGRFCSGDLRKRGVLVWFFCGGSVVEGVLNVER